MLLNIFQQGLDPYQLFIAVLSVLVVAITAFAYHEFAHAYVADRLGDPTPRENGRMTLNPFPHLSLVGMILLLFIGFGWATTPINPSKLRGDIRRSMALVSIAGPLANLLMALLFAIPYQLVNAGILDAQAFEFSDFRFFFQMGLLINVILFVFNLLPIPPLDGFTILVGIVPEPLSRPLIALRQSGYTSFIFLAVIFLLPMLGYDVFGVIFAVVDPIIN
ncbi:MAG: site-2 protease family protein, partial [Anaerolineae bacterium]